jgi:heme-degrading monooxygenase HmoA
MAWNLTCGIPLMAPSLTYRGVDDDHHKGSVYGRRRDGEYVPFGAQPRYRIFAYLLLPLVLPPLFAARFIVLAPLSLLHPRLRALLWRRASSLAIDLGYQNRELQRCVETRDRYLLLVLWDSLASHTEDFRRSPAYERWRDLLHRFCEFFPTVEHYVPVPGASA